MTEQEFIDAGAAQWSRLRALVERARKDGISRLGPDDLIALHEGYRRAAADLAYAQTHFAGTGTLAELNALVGAAHGFLYASPSRRLTRLVRFYTSDVPALVRDKIGPIALACVLLLGSATFAFGAAMSDARLGRALLPAHLREAVGERLQTPSRAAEGSGSLGTLLSTEIMLNNVRVGFASFAGGALAGTLTVYVLVANGLLLGALAGLFARAGLSLPFWALIAPHGALELPAIAIAAGAGFVIAEAIVNPGELPRRQTIRAAANVAVRLLLGTVPIFVVAAMVEGFITPADAPAALKVTFGVAALVALVAWLGLGGRQRPSPGTGS